MRVPLPSIAEAAHRASYTAGGCALRFGTGSAFASALHGFPKELRKELHVLHALWARVVSLLAENESVEPMSS